MANKTEQQMRITYRKGFLKSRFVNYLTSPKVIHSKVGQYVIPIFILGIVTLICFFISDEIGYQIVSLILLCIISILATFFSIGPILLSSTLSALVWNFFFIPPKFTFHIDRAENVLMFGMFFFIALVNGVLTSRVRNQEQLAREREERTNALFQLTKKLTGITGLDKVIHASYNEIKLNFDLDAVFFINDGKDNLSIKNLGFIEISKTDSEAADFAFKQSKKAGMHTEDFAIARLTFYPLKGTRIKLGVVGVYQKATFSSDRKTFWDTFIAQISNAIEREFLDELARKAMILDESDKLYKTLFNSISHELRIPVATIMGATDTLISSQYNNETRHELYSEIIKASLRLNRLIENLLNISRLESGRISPRKDWCDLHDLVNKVAEDLSEELKLFSFITDISDDMPLVKLDFGLMEQVLYNLIINSCQYAPASTEIRLIAFHKNGNLNMYVKDRGPGFPEETLTMVFNKFFKVKGTKTGGTGLGLSIVKGFVEAHNGKITVENRKNGGAKFHIMIPSEITDIKNIPD